MVKITIKAARVNAGLTQKQAAEALKVGEKTISFWENGTTFPNVQQACALCELYNVPYDYINFLPLKPLKAE